MMGDRANAYIREDGEHGVFLYSHWAGTELPLKVQEALQKGRDRWNDNQYLARIVFQTMLDGDTGTTGYGISALVGDGDRRVLILDPETQRAAFGRVPDGAAAPEPSGQWIPFAEFAAEDFVPEWP